MNSFLVFIFHVFIIKETLGNESYNFGINIGSADSKSAKFGISGGLNIGESEAKSNLDISLGGSASSNNNVEGKTRLNIDLGESLNAGENLIANTENLLEKSIGKAELEVDEALNASSKLDEKLNVGLDLKVGGSGSINVNDSLNVNLGGKADLTEVDLEGQANSLLNESGLTNLNLNGSENLTVGLPNLNLDLNIGKTENKLPTFNWGNGIGGFSMGNENTLQGKISSDIKSGTSLNNSGIGGFGLNVEGLGKNMWGLQDNLNVGLKGGNNEIVNVKMNPFDWGTKPSWNWNLNYTTFGQNNTGITNLPGQNLNWNISNPFKNINWSDPFGLAAKFNGSTSFNINSKNNSQGLNWGVGEGKINETESIDSIGGKLKDAENINITSKLEGNIESEGIQKGIGKIGGAMDIKGGFELPKWNIGAGSVGSLKIPGDTVEKKEISTDFKTGFELPKWNFGTGIGVGISDGKLGTPSSNLAQNVHWNISNPFENINWGNPLGIGINLTGSTNINTNSDNNFKGLNWGKNDGIGKMDLKGDLQQQGNVNINLKQEGNMLGSLNGRNKQNGNLTIGGGYKSGFELPNMNFGAGSVGSMKLPEVGAINGIDKLNVNGNVGTTLSVGSQDLEKSKSGLRVEIKSLNGASGDLKGGIHSLGKVDLDAKNNAGIESGIQKASLNFGFEMPKFDFGAGSIGSLDLPKVGDINEINMKNDKLNMNGDLKAAVSLGVGDGMLKNDDKLKDIQKLKNGIGVELHNLDGTAGDLAGKVGTLSQGSFNANLDFNNNVGLGSGTPKASLNEGIENVQKGIDGLKFGLEVPKFDFGVGSVGSLELPKVGAMNGMITKDDKLNMNGNLGATLSLGLEDGMTRNDVDLKKIQKLKNGLDVEFKNSNGAADLAGKMNTLSRVDIDAGLKSDIEGLSINEGIGKVQGGIDGLKSGLDFTAGSVGSLELPKSNIGATLGIREKNEFGAGLQSNFGAAGNLRGNLGGEGSLNINVNTGLEADFKDELGGINKINEAVQSEVDQDIKGVQKVASELDGEIEGGLNQLEKLGESKIRLNVEAGIAGAKGKLEVEV